MTDRLCRIKAGELRAGDAVYWIDGHWLKGLSKKAPPERDVSLHTG